MKRRASDPRVKVIAAAIDRAIASPHNCHDELVCTVAATILDLGDTCDRFSMISHRWTRATARASLIAFALQVPVPVLNAMAKVARGQLKWLEWWDVKGWDETGESIATLEREVWRPRQVSP